VKSAHERAAEIVANADALLIGAGAGMGVDSGLPDFRGNEGFWRAYPPFAKLGLGFMDMANPRWFSSDPRLAWGFYGHRLNLYRATAPHAGFEILRGWGERMPRGCFVFTSNVDGQFQKAGFPDESIVECHGSIHHLQCSGGCDGIRDAADVSVEVDQSTFRVVGDLPLCPDCGAVARPNILMFGDWGWLSERSGEQDHRFDAWQNGLRDARLVVVECGAGSAVPTVRYQCEAVAGYHGGTLIRINPREPGGPPGTISFETSALEALRGIDDLL
jgi:NAD-dependent SIR2 family protein deacetylase